MSLQCGHERSPPLASSSSAVRTAASPRRSTDLPLLGPLVHHRRLRLLLGSEACSFPDQENSKSGLAHHRTPGEALGAADPAQTSPCQSQGLTLWPKSARGLSGFCSQLLRCPSASHQHSSPSGASHSPQKSSDRLGGKQQNRQKHGKTNQAQENSGLELLTCLGLCSRI